ncbi:MAG: pre-peptidase C-terminal domain-containing protein [Xenococcaceae cyanobacterium MO_167.B52]|nr:pre-peptidase C-terminal domain-containing protein [Xenococcaceae cyanobacterium MO_167.B52]
MSITSKINFLGAISPVLLITVLLTNTIGVKSAQGSQNRLHQVQHKNSLSVFSVISTPQVARASSTLEQEVLTEINRARTNPQEYAAWLESLKEYYDGNTLKLPGEKKIRTNRGITVLEEAISFVKEQSPLSPLATSEDLTLTAEEKVTNFIDNKRNRDLTNISYGKVTPEAIVMQLVVDERYRDRRHRLAIFNPNYRLTGVVCEKDRRYDQVCGIAYEVASNDIATGNSNNINSPNSGSSSGSVSLNPNLIEKTERGILEVGDKTIPNDGSLYDSYPLEGKAGDSFIITVESQDFDTFLAIMDQTGEIIEQNDDISDRNSNSRLKVTLPNSGTYNVIVNAYDKGGKGKYVLTVRR